MSTHFYRPYIPTESKWTYTEPFICKNTLIYKYEYLKNNVFTSNPNKGVRVGQMELDVLDSLLDKIKNIMETD